MGIADEERVSMVMVCLEGAVLGWFQYRELRHPFEGWREFREELLQRFGPAQVKSPQEELVSLKQNETVAEFREKFEWLTAALPSADEGWLMGVFMAGLEDDVQAEVRLFGPNNLDAMMKLVQHIEANNWALKGYRKPNTTGSSMRPPALGQGLFRKPIPPQLLNQPNKHNPSVKNQTDIVSPNSNQVARTFQPRRGQGFQRLSPEEFRAKLDRGLCFRCDEPYSPNH